MTAAAVRSASIPTFHRTTRALKSLSQLCDLWRRETGQLVTANPVRLGAYTGRPQSAPRHFVCAAVEALQPTAAMLCRLPHPSAGRGSVMETGATMRGGFRAPVSARHLSISVSAWLRLVRLLTETGSRRAP
jgi:hypothetical protein